jgi:outer membrane scaffolding protein for murein synthesis (MipA/OmpV family)
MRKSRFRLIALLLPLFLSPSVVIGAEKPLWEVGAGLALLQMPDYRGSDENRLYLLPYPYLIYRGDILTVDRERISGRLFRTDKLLLDVSFFGQVPVDSSDNEARRGMPDLDPTFEVGPSLQVTLLDNRQDRYSLKLLLPARAFFSTDFSSLRREGWVFSPRLVFEKEDLIPESGLNLGISAGPLFGDSGAHAYYYSVAPAYATPSRPAYAATGGYSGSTLTLGLSKSHHSFLFGAFLSVDALSGAVIEDSPLVRKKFSVMSGLTVSWIFKTSTTAVTAER